MDANITLNSIPFAKTFDERGGSERQSSARGINTPDVLIVKHQDATDNTYKSATKRRMIRIDRVAEDEDGKKYNTSAYLVLVIPEEAASEDTDNVLATLRALVASSDPDYLDQLLNNER